MLSDVIELIQATGAPGVTTDKIYNVSGSLFWNGTDISSGGGIASVVDDTSPQLGGDLDVNGNDIVAATGGDHLWLHTADSATSVGDVRLYSGNRTGGGGAEVLIWTGTATGGFGGDVKIQTGNSDISAGDIELLPGLDTVDQDNNGQVIFGNAVGATIAVQVGFREARTNGFNAVFLQAPVSITSNAVWTLPAHQQTSGMMMGIDLGEFTVAGLPSASTYPNCWALATNASGGRTMVRSDGTNWKVVAVEGGTVST